eukprot:TRINITY_DN14742_c0_g1_i1.p1 TRINITY_DN14742_c0_g1~~TRINITY_DN14742_c0_g1_i1.p1  ORF type:complete len:849 (-),score=218.47 TRINITY_DN14742_c0_g1_i1:57-2603(-)
MTQVPLSARSAGSNDLLADLLRECVEEPDSPTRCARAALASGVHEYERERSVNETLQQTVLARTATVDTVDPCSPDGYDSAVETLDLPVESPETKAMPSNDEIDEYMKKHDLQSFLAGLVSYLARYLPSEPLDFIVKNIEAIVIEHRTSSVRARLAAETPPPHTVAMLEAQSGDDVGMSAEQQDRIVKRVRAALQHPETTRAAAGKLFRQFVGDRHSMVEADFQELVKYLEASWGLRPRDGALMLAVLKRWRFRSNAATGKRGLPLWPLSADDFGTAYASLLRAVRDRYAPIGGRVQRSMFIKKTMGSLEDKYEVGASLGRGSYGEVFLVTTKSTQERRVCKCVPRRQQLVPREELLSEVEMLRCLDHPHICMMFEYFESADQIEMIIEAAFGGTLERLTRDLYLDGQRPTELTEAWLATLLTQLLGALTYAHDVVGVIHKDLKCDNVLLVGKPGLPACEVLKQPLHAMLADFGIAEVFSPDVLSRATLAAGGTGLADELSLWSGNSQAFQHGLPGRPHWKMRCSRAGGTPTYMSPEIFQGSFTEKCDIWSLGVLMFQCMTGELPYRGDNLLHQMHMVGDPRRHPNWDLLTKFEWSLGARLFCQLLLSKDEGMRPTAAEAARDGWLQRERRTQPTQPPDPAEVASLKQQHMQSHLMQMARHCIASQLSLQPLHHLYQRFGRYDTEGDGVLSYLEMRQALEDVGITFDGDAEILIEALDSNRNGTIEYTEFLAGCLDLASEEMRKHLRSVFDVFDLDNSGAISTDELRQVLLQGANPDSTAVASGHTSTAIGVGFGLANLLPDGKTVEDVMADLDADKTGQVEYAELERYLLAEQHRLEPLSPCLRRSG